VTHVDLPGIDAIGIRADNPGALTLTGTNSWVLGRNPAWVVDPGPALADHVAALTVEVQRRGGLGGIALTHDHPDHSEGAPVLREHFPGAQLAGARGDTDVLLREGTRFGPLEALATPGHAPDHFAFLVDTLAFTGDAVLGTGSVFIAPDPGALAGYLDGLAALRARPLTLLAPGHGPVVRDPDAKLEEYIAHRREREERLLAALGAGARSVPDLLAAAWDDVPEPLRPAATVTLAAHLDKLADEQRLPSDVERPRLSELTPP
jgi:glyoxylase-like metal-dependent hydrolase (beta-lactamase superfamily II)